MKIEIVDDGIGAFATLNKLKYVFPADYTVRIMQNLFPLGNLSRGELISAGKRAFLSATERGAEAVVFSSGALSVAAAKILSAATEVPLFGCEAPILHAATYTASQVLLAGDCFVARATRLPNVISVDLGELPILAERMVNEREIVDYIAQNTEKYYGAFDCIALGNSSMNLYKHCFSRVFPNIKIFDSLDGTARRLRKKFKKNAKEDSTVAVIDENNEDLSEKYNFFIEEFN